jgi:hypothetical protein
MNRDVLDKVRAMQFAWRMARPGETFVLPQDEAPEAEPPSSPAVATQVNEAFRDQALATSRALALEVARAWAMRDERAQLRATKALVRRAHDAGLQVVAMHEFPLEAVRFGRLAVRHMRKLSKNEREAAFATVTFLELPHEEAGELLVEIARAGASDFAEAVLWNEDAELVVGDTEVLARRLAELVDAGPTDRVRAVALDLLQVVDERVTIPAVRRALRLPSFPVRARAMRNLVAYDPPAIEEADLRFALQDLVVHPPPEDTDDAAEADQTMLADAILAALAVVQPAEGEDALLELEAAELSALITLDCDWAREALAVGYPETAASLLEEKLRCTDAYQRMRALDAVARLREDHARRLLLLAATDAAPDVREQARATWFDRFGEACPLDELAGLATDLLEGPPSDRFRARLTVLRGRSEEARKKMAKALLPEAPDREALVLLLLALADDRLEKEPRWKHDEPAKGWAADVVCRFGSAAVKGMCALAARYPVAANLRSWLGLLGALVEACVIGEEDVAKVRAAAMDALEPGTYGAVKDPLELLAVVGAPAEGVDVLLAYAFDDDDATFAAANALATAQDETLDARLAAHMEEALAGRDDERFERASRTAFKRRGEGALAVARNVLARVDDEEDLINMAVRCAQALSPEELQAWAVEALAHPDRASFEVAARACFPAKGRVRARLEEALSSSARGGASATEAAVALLRAEPKMKVRDRRLVPILGAAPLAARAGLLAVMLGFGAPLAPLERHVEELYTSSDVTVTSQLAWTPGSLGKRGRALLLRVLPKVVDAELRAEIDDALDREPDASSYWRDD